MNLKQKYKDELHKINLLKETGTKDLIKTREQNLNNLRKTINNKMHVLTEKTHNNKLQIKKHINKIAKQCHENQNNGIIGFNKLKRTSFYKKPCSFNNPCINPHNLVMMKKALKNENDSSKNYIKKYFTNYNDFKLRYIKDNN